MQRLEVSCAVWPI